MNDETNSKTPQAPSEKTSSGKSLLPQAVRALAEAEERRAKSAKDEAAKGPKELQGPKGLEPTRFGDWEHKGIASDF